MELKFTLNTIEDDGWYCFNRTFMELKLGLRGKKRMDREF